MQAETLNCPMCGAPAASDATACAHCGARLATVACPSCFGMNFEGAKFCSHCGAVLQRTEAIAEAPRSCPRCRVDMSAAVIGSTKLMECPKCEGLWMDNATLQEICGDREKQASVLGMAAHLPEPGFESLESIRYVPCPVCHELMNRVNFAHCSHIILDVCGKDGTWFDKDELRKVVEFIRAGGMDQARQRELEALKQQRSELRTDQIAGAGLAGGGGALDGASYSGRYDGIDMALDVAAAAIRLFIK